MHSYLKDPADFSKVRRVLVIKLQHLGDVLLASPVFSVLKQRYPHLEIDALIFADTAPMLSGNVNISRIFTLERKSGKVARKSIWQLLAQEYRLYRQFQTRGYDVVIALTDRMRAAWTTRLLRPAYSVAQKYPDKRGSWWRNSFTHLYSVPAAPRHTVEMHLDALRRLGVYPQGPEKQLQLVAGSEAEARIAKLCADYQLQPGGYIVVHPASRWMFKGWNVAGFAEVLRELTARNLPIVLVSGPEQAEHEYVQLIAGHHGLNLINLAGQLNLKELAQLIGQARCFLGLDSVAMHIAAAVGTPCVALFGPSNEKIWGPWMVAHRVITANYSCRPCNMDGCGNGKVSDCLQTIGARTVSDAVCGLINAA